MLSYHGTSFAHASYMSQGNISVTRGGGEFGRGFYTQNSRVNAARWALTRYPNPAILEIGIPDHLYDSFHIVRLDLMKARKLVQRLRSTNKTNTYVRKCDVIEGPLVGSPQHTQYKFESDNAQDVLNGSEANREVTAI